MSECTITSFRYFGAVTAGNGTILPAYKGTPKGLLIPTRASAGKNTIATDTATPLPDQSSAACDVFPCISINAANGSAMYFGGVKQTAPTPGAAVILTTETGTATATYADVDFIVWGLSLS